MLKLANYEFKTDAEVRKNIIDEFIIPEEALDGVELLIAYNSEGYSADAFFLYRCNGQLFEVHASHCSCFGYEGQWRPEATSMAALLARIEKPGWMFDTGESDREPSISRARANQYVILLDNSKHRCHHCASISPDDANGNCSACGAPRWSQQ